MGLLDKRAADWTARDATNVWAWTGIIDLLKILLVFPLFFRSVRPKRTQAEIKQGMDEYGAKLRREQFYRDLEP